MERNALKCYIRLVEQPMHSAPPPCPPLPSTPILRALTSRKQLCGAYSEVSWLFWLAEQNSWEKWGGNLAICYERGKINKVIFVLFVVDIVLVSLLFMLAEYTSVWTLSSFPPPPPPPLHVGRVYLRVDIVLVSPLSSCWPSIPPCGHCPRFPSLFMYAEYTFLSTLSSFSLSLYVC